ncbi:MAG: hypothetical protein FJX72_10875, partial [Armatimonadetes bacterium]|nr:hypothetical protein [Armatimonadota bacterium]
MSFPRVVEARHRLPIAAYSGRRMVSFTACVSQRRHLFSEPGVVSAFAPMLKDCASRYACDVLVYCFMPDHLHAVLQGSSAGSNAKQAFDA